MTYAKASERVSLIAGLRALHRAVAIPGRGRKLSPAQREEG